MIVTLAVLSLFAVEMQPISTFQRHYADPRGEA